MSSYKSNNILNSLCQSLPDDKPITHIQVIENLENQTPGFTVINKSYDQDQDADLWREGALFLKRKITRYLSISKTQGISNLVVEEILIINEKSVPPQGFSLISRTADTDQKAWRKKQLCYKLGDRQNAKRAVTDIIVCSRLKKAPEGFTLVGEINGVIICYKMGNVQNTEQLSGYNNDNISTNSNDKPPERPPRPTGSPMYPHLNNTDGDHDYEILHHPGYVPLRPAPQPPTPREHQQSSTHTLSSNFNGLEGVPFVLNSKLQGANSSEKYQYPIIKLRTMEQLLKEYDYDFVLEHQS